MPCNRAWHTVGIWSVLFPPFSPFLTKWESIWLPWKCTIDEINSDLSLRKILCQSLPYLYVFHTLLLPSLLQKAFLSKSPWHTLLSLSSCVLPHSPVMLEQYSYSPGEYLPSLISSFNSLPKCYFLILVFPELCVPSSQQLKCKRNK